MPKVSVIIPIHNSELWLQDMLNSVVNQTLTDIEILCIDDDSSDNTPEILHHFSQQDSRIQLFSRRHAPDEKWGYTHAINIGRQHAKGQYICFWDSDDIVPLDALSNLYNASENGSIDIIKGRLEIINNGQSVFISTSGNKLKCDSWLDLPENLRVFHLCNGPELQSFLIRNDFQKDIPFCTSCYMDTTTAFKLKVLASSFQYIDNITYRSIQHDKSYKPFYFDLIRVFDELDAFLKQTHINPEIWDYFHLLKTNALCVANDALYDMETLPIYLPYLIRDFQYIDCPLIEKYNPSVASILSHIKKIKLDYAHPWQI